MIYQCQWCGRTKKTWGFDWPDGWLSIIIKIGTKLRAVVCSEACKHNMDVRPELRRVMWH